LEKAMETLASLEPTSGEAGYDVQAFDDKCHAAMNDDFNTPILIATLFDGVKAVNGAAAGRVSLSAEDIASLKGTFDAFLRSVLGLQAESAAGGAEGDPSETGALLDLIVDMRTTAKSNKDWGTADKIRDVLSAHGITIQDGKDGSSWTRG